MPYGPELDRLALRFAEQPTSTCFAALAEGLRKGGVLDEAAAVASQGVAARPDYLPGHLVLARIYRDQRQWELAEKELRTAVGIDADHPLVLESLAQLAQLSGGVRGQLPTPRVAVEANETSEADPAETEATELVYTDAIADDTTEAAVDATPSGDALLTESLAMLYWGQGHLERAVEVFDALVARNAGNHDLAGRRDAVRAELDALRPPAYDAAHSGGRPVREWLSSLAAVKAPGSPPPSSFDAFYQTPSAPPSEHGDLAAFQAWLRELGR